MPFHITFSNAIANGGNCNYFREQLSYTITKMKIKKDDFFITNIYFNVDKRNTVNEFPENV